MRKGKRTAGRDAKAGDTKRKGHEWKANAETLLQNTFSV